jgi:hypothetical protein
MLATKSIAEQLTDIYFEEEWWHTTRMTYEQALNYHQTRLDTGAIYVFEKEGEVLGYYERYFRNNVCFLHNVFVKDIFRRGEVFKGLCRHFFSTMPDHIEYVEGEKQKLGKLVTEKIKRGKNGNH